MAKASLKLPNGPVITLEGTPEEVKHLLDLYSYSGKEEPRAKPAAKGHGTPKVRVSEAAEIKNDEKLDLNQIVTLAKDCDEAEAIEERILDIVQPKSTALCFRSTLSMNISTMHMALPLAR